MTTTVVIILWLLQRLIHVSLNIVNMDDVKQVMVVVCAIQAGRAYLAQVSLNQHVRILN